MISIQVTNKKQSSKFEHPVGPLEFGRGPKQLVERFVVNDLFVSRDQLRIEELPGGKLQVENLSIKQEVTLDDGSKIAVGARRELPLPARLVFGQTSVDIAVVKGEAIERKSLGTVSQPVAGGQDTTVILTPLKELGTSPTPEVLTHWLETVVGLQRSTANPADFYKQTARALVDLIGLDSGLILLRKDFAWELVGHFPPEKGGEPTFSRTLLSHVATERRTFFQDLKKLASTESLAGVGAAVVSPIFGVRDEVIGALYGARQRNVFVTGGITPLEAQIVQLLAAVIGANLIRLQALRSQAQRDQFPRSMSAELENEPALLEGQEKEVSLLVGRLQGYPELARHLGPKRACQLARELMSRLEGRIGEQNGVVVEAKGDGILAMWNAPIDQRDHALMACAAALGLREETNEINSRWQAQGGKPLSPQVAIHTGAAQVGNMGGKQFRYRPFGPALDTASRLLDAAARLGRPVLMSAGTQNYLPDTMATRRLCQVRLLRGGEPVALYELHGVSATPQWLASRDTYESALMQYEFGQWSRACTTLVPLLQQAEHQEHYDVPTMKLARQICACMEREPASFDPIFDLDAM